MHIGIFGGDTANRTIDDVVADARQAEADGFASYWLPQIFGMDAISTLAIVGREVPRIELGTAVVPTYPRHPMMLAQQALTTQVASGGRFILGIGLSHQIVIENMFGMSFDKPARHMREYLAILAPLVRGDVASFDGETLSAHGAISVAGATPCPILLAALAPRMLALAGGVADGTITWMTGPKTLADHIVPSLTKAAGNRDVRVVAALRTCVTDDPDGARERTGQAIAFYGHLPSYRAMLDREGVAGPADMVIAGDEKEVAAGIARVEDAGATDFLAAETGITAEERTRTRDLLRSLL
jgi:5,10-methylenetetrahydromethanopterin reductase